MPSTHISIIDHCYHTSLCGFEVVFEEWNAKSSIMKSVKQPCSQINTIPLEKNTHIMSDKAR